MKKCNNCKTEKPESEFHACKLNKDGLYANCKECKKLYDKKYRQSDKVQNAQKSQKYRDRKIEYQKFLMKDPRFHILQAAKARAKKQNLPFDITIDDIIIPEYCPILEIKLERKPYGNRTGWQMSSPSLDKIVPEKGYVKGNIMVISMRANAMKYSASLEELEIFCKNIKTMINKYKNDNS